MKVFRYVHTYRGYDGSHITHSGYVFAMSNAQAHEYVMNEYCGEGSVTFIDEVHVIEDRCDD